MNRYPVKSLLTAFVLLICFTSNTLAAGSAVNLKNSKEKLEQKTETEKDPSSEKSDAFERRPMQPEVYPATTWNPFIGWGYSGGGGGGDGWKAIVVLFVILAAVPPLIYAADRPISERDASDFHGFHFEARGGFLNQWSDQIGFLGQVNARYSHFGAEVNFDSIRLAPSAVNERAVRARFTFEPRKSTILAMTLGQKELTGTRSATGWELGFPIRLAHQNKLEYGWDVFFSFFGSYNLYEFLFEAKYKVAPFVFSAGYQLKAFSDVPPLFHGPVVQVGLSF